jgi:uncharacterized protein involved in response to NO
MSTAGLADTEGPARTRRGGTPPLLANGFRPFFLGAALWLPLALLIWLLELVALLAPASHPAPPAWHPHEALFGGVGAIVAGFLLTAVPNWTGRLPVRGRHLLLLFLLWVAARIAGLGLGGLPPLAALPDIAFHLALLGLVAREIVRGRNWRNLPLVALLALFATGDLLSHLDAPGLAGSGAVGRRLGLAAVLMLIALIGGRIVPSFTRNWLARAGVTTLPAPFGGFDRLVLALWAVTLAAWVAGLPAHLSGTLFLASGFLHVARMVRWQGHRTFAEPLVTVLHAACAWLGIGALLHGLALDGLGLDPATALHAFTTGAIGTMTLAVMTRASLGHTGRALTADRTTVAIYLLVTAGAVLRLLVPVLPADPVVTLALAALGWGGAYLLFALHYGPMLVRPRIETGG